MIVCWQTCYCSSVMSLLKISHSIIGMVEYCVGDVGDCDRPIGKNVLMMLSEVIKEYPQYYDDYEKKSLRSSCSLYSTMIYQR